MSLIKAAFALQGPRGVARQKNYVAAHARVTRSMQHALHSSGWWNYALFLCPTSGVIVGVFDCPFASGSSTDALTEAMAKIDSLPGNVEWQALMAPFLTPPAVPLRVDCVFGNAANYFTNRSAPYDLSAVDTSGGGNVVAYGCRRTLLVGAHSAPNEDALRESGAVAMFTLTPDKYKSDDAVLKNFPERWWFVESARALPDDVAAAAPSEVMWLGPRQEFVS